MLAISLKDTLGVKYSEDYIKLSVAQSDHIYPTKVNDKKKKKNCDLSIICMCVWGFFFYFRQYSLLAI